MIQTILNNIQIIVNDYQLLTSFLFSGLFGAMALYIAFDMCGSPKILHKVFKYIPAAGGIWLLSGFFLLLMDPFSKGIGLLNVVIYILMFSVALVVSWGYLHDHVTGKRTYHY